VTASLLAALARVGRGVRRPGRWGLRAAVLMIGSAGLSVVAVVGVLVMGAVSDRQAQSRSLLPIAAEDATDAEFLYAFDLDLLPGADGNPHLVSVVWLEPLTNSAQPPPGVLSWPRPGQAVASPVAQRDLNRLAVDLYGPIVGTISPRGLEAPGERRIYVRPTASALENTGDEMTMMNGFGGPGVVQGLWGVPTLDAQASWVTPAALIFFLFSPAAVAVWLGAGVDRERRRRRELQLVAIGAGVRHRMIVNLAEVWPPIAAGGLVGGGALGVMATNNFDVGWLDTIVLADATRTRLLAGVGAITIAQIAALLIALLTGRRNTQRKDTAEAIPFRSAQVCVVAAIAAIWLPSIFPAYGTLLYYASAVVTTVTLPSLIAMIVAGLGRVIAATGLKRGWPGMLLAGRRHAVSPRRTAWLTSSVVVSILLFGQVQLWASTLGGLVQRDLGQLSSGDLVVSGGHVHDSGASDIFLKSVGKGTAPVFTWLEDNRTRQFGFDTYIATSCTTLALLGASCMPSEVPVATLAATGLGASLVNSTGIFTETINVEPFESEPDYERMESLGADFSLVSTDGSSLPVLEIQRVGNQLFVGGTNLDTIVNRNKAAGNVPRQLQHWVLVLGTLGLIPLLLAAGVVLVADSRSSARETAILAAHFDRRRWLAGVALTRILLPLALGGITASLFYFFLPISVGAQASEGFFKPSTSYVAVSLSLTIALGLVGSWWSYRSSKAWATT